MKLLAFSIWIFLWTHIAFAQNTRTDSSFHTQQNNLREQLGISPEQESKLKDYRMELSNRRREIFNNSQLNDEEKRSQLYTLQKERKAKMRQIFTRPQLKELKRMRKEKKIEKGDLKNKGRRKSQNDPNSKDNS